MQGIMLTTTAVSYTHLDVYKRQYYHGYFICEKKKLHDCRKRSSSPLSAYGYISFGCCLFCTKGDFSVGKQRAAGFASLLYMRQFFKCCRSSFFRTAKFISFCNECFVDVYKRQVCIMEKAEKPRVLVWKLLDSCANVWTKRQKGQALTIP